MFKKIINTSSFVQSFVIEEKIYLLSDNKIQVFDKDSAKKINENQIFKKSGLARSFILDKKFIYCKDFIHLYIIEKDTLEIISKIKLGIDLKTDICSIGLNENYIIIGIRNGKIATIEKEKWSKIKYYPLSKSSIWDMKIKGHRIYAGNVDGQLLSINSDSMQIEQSINAHKKNTKSIFIIDSVIATAAQDKKLMIWNLDTLELINMKRNSHRKAFIIGGHWSGKLVTVGFSSGEMKVWDIKKLTEEKVIPIKNCLSGNVIIDSSKLYIGSRAINGIECSEIEDIIQ